MNRTDFLVHTVALAAQGMREATGMSLIDARIQPFALLQQLEQTLACVHMVFESSRIAPLREAIEADFIESAGDGTVMAALLLYDVCQALELDECETQRALSLTDWSDVMCALASEIETPVDMCICIRA